MADALCGPSNALQNFQKHATVDRTLQQDRLSGHHTPQQQFRSSAGQHAGALDPEFEAFQAGRAGPPPPQDFQPHLPQYTQPQPHLPQYTQPQPQYFAQAPQASNWASDFRRLNISNPPVQPLQRQQPQAASASAWHQDFMMQQASATQVPISQAQPTYGGMSEYDMNAFGGNSFMQTPMYQRPTSETSQGKQQAQEAVPAFDEAAFEQAFLQAEAEAAQEVLAEFEQSATENASAVPEAAVYDRPGEMDPLLLRMRETRPAVYSALQVWSETGLGRTAEAVTYLENMASLEQNGKLVEDANEARWIVDSLNRIVNRDTTPQEVKSRAENLVTAINERLMSQYPLGTQAARPQNEKIWGELEAAGYMRSPVQERPIQQKTEQQRKEELPQHNDQDEMAETAGKLLEKVADNTSEKFQNSQFLELMRRLRDREVRVEDDKIVEVNDQITASTAGATAQSQQQQQQQHLPNNTQQNTTYSTTRIPAIDPTILSHAATDFEIPTYSDDPSQQGFGQQAI